MHTYQCTHIHTHTGVVLEMLFYTIIIIFLIIPYLVGLQSDSADLESVVVWQSVWLVVSLPYGRVRCVNTGLWGLLHQQNWSCSTRTHGSKWNTNWVWFQKRYVVRWGDLGLLIGGNRTSLHCLGALPETHLLCSDLLCMHKVYVSFCLDWLWRKYIYFL